ncbi:hypothetical protein B0T14DRAFT_31919 [Immersiella caudata]|uniref:Uncharacterized protein n=1 Tax=Immersiella caudata TaxID=314043 RepID=A0AA40CCI9_9PEZI|nr:hypothetical protein B0T14DRAFT_31919 [Immersiella caudata]
MDHVHTARRSTSHGSLNRSYTANAAAHAQTAPLRSNPFSRPLRSVNENSSLLASPGPLESMLKTTTETGDIGPFSIQPIRPPIRPSATYNGPFRIRPGPGEPSFSRAATRSGVNGSDHRDGGRRLPSYRDTTSEIISMYGSDSQRSASSSLSPPFDDLAQRSYSMTSCSSRVLPYQKPSRALQDSTNQTLLQRPRSPFPYPTRLKRPGVRPSSPALTDNGIDYSRMVGIDRVSYRTVHGSYKPTYPRYGRRPTPKLSRFRANSPGDSYMRHDGNPGSQLSRTMSSSLPPGWRNRCNGRFDRSASEQSLRSSSLTSIVDMYRPPSCTPSVQSLPLRSQTYGTFYYDYSEDFDSRPQPVVAPAPVAPVPTRIPSFRRATVLNDGYDAGLQIPAECELDPRHERPSKDNGKLGSNDEDRTEPISRQFHSPYLEALEQKDSRDSIGSAKNGPHSREEATRMTEPPTKHLVPPTGDLLADQEGGSYGKHEIISEDKREKYPMRLGDVTQPGRTTARQDPPSGHDSYDQLDFATHPELTTNLQKLTSAKCNTTYHTHPVPEPITRSASPASIDSRRKTKVYSIEPGLSDLASLVQHLDKATDFVDEDESSIFSRVDLPIGLWAESPRDPPDCLKTNSPRDNEDTNKNGFTDDFRGHKRNFAVPRIDADHLPITSKLSPTETAQWSIVNGGALQPRPATGRLRLQNSAPQLMKALPPLPSASVRSESYIANIFAEDPDPPAEFPPLELSRITTPMSMLSEVSSLDIPRSRQNGDFGTLISSKDGGRMGNFRHNQNSTLAKALSLGVDPSCRLGIYPFGREAGSLMVPTIREEQKSPKPSNGKLRLRVSRGAMAKAQVELKHHPSHITLRPVVVGFESCSELPVLPPLELYSLDAGVDNETDRGRKEPFRATFQPEIASASGSGSGPTPGTSLIMLSSRIEGQELKEAPQHVQKPASRASSASLTNARSSLSDRGSASKTSHGLRKRISDLRVRVVEARMRSAEPPSPKDQTPERDEHASPPIALATVQNDMVNESTEDVGEADSHSMASRGFRGRMSGWMRAVRHAVMVACAGSRKRG